MLISHSTFGNSNGFMVWSDIEKNIIYGKYLNGTGLVTELVTTNIAAVGESRAAAYSHSLSYHFFFNFV